MIFLFISIFIFLFTMLVHIGLYRYLKKTNITQFNTKLIFILGWLINISVMWFLVNNVDKYINNSSNWWNWPLPYISVFLFTLLSIIYITMITGPIYGTIGPTYKIIFLLQKEIKLSENEIISRFTNQELIINRLQILIKNGLIKKTYNRYFATSKGTRYFRLINFYRIILNWNLGG